VVSRRPGGLTGTNEPRYYPVLTERRLVELRELCEAVSERSSLTKADLMGAVESLISMIPKYLQDGCTVKLGEFGSFNLHASSLGKDTPQEVTSRDISKVKMTFLPSKLVKRQLAKTDFKKVK
jgi:predicted histone-like DNA-binding protein